MSETKKRKNNGLKSAASSTACAEKVQRYGSAAKEHFVSYSGIDNETGKILHKSLKSISEQKVNPEFEYQNMKQKAGFAAEVKETANANAEAIINGSAERKVRTDDIGNVNDPLYDHVKLDSDGNVIPGSGSQMKFVGDTPKETLSKLASKEYEKYLENDVPMDMPSDQYEGILKEADKRIEKLDERLKRATEKGDTESAKALGQKIEKYRKIKKNIRKSSVSNKDADIAVKHPKLSVAKSVVEVSHKAGLESAETSALIGFAVSSIKHFAAIINDEETIEESMLNLTKDTASAAARGYVTGFAGSAIKGAMQNANSQVVRSLSATSFPTIIVTTVIDASATFYSFYKGEIDAEECVDQLKEKAFTTVVSTVFSAAGNSIAPGIGGVIGGIVGYVLASASYQAVKQLTNAKKEREQIEELCREHIELIREYRAQTEEALANYFSTSIGLFHEAFDGIKSALDIGDIDGFITSTNLITESFGKKPLFQTQDECDKLIMDNDFIIKI